MQEEDIIIGKRSIFQPTEEEKILFKKQKLERKIARQKKYKINLGKTFETIDAKIAKAGKDLELLEEEKTLQKENEPAKSVKVLMNKSSFFFPLLIFTIDKSLSEHLHKEKYLI